MNIAEKLESIDCRKDTKARRVLNVAPDQSANITAEELESGITLERMEALNVPVFCYSGQITIHGQLPSFNPAARPGGYKAVFQNQNGSIGVRYGAIDSAKKKLIARACCMAGNFGSNATSQGFEVSRCFYVKEESDRAQAKADTLAALKALPSSRFFGTCYAFALMYGMGYGIAANIGAIPADELWPLIADLTGIKDEAELIALETKANLESDIARAASHAAYLASCSKDEAEFAEQWQSLLPTLRPLTVAPVAGQIIVKNCANFIVADLEHVKGRHFYKVVADKDGQRYGAKRKLAKSFPWPKALAAGNVFVKIAA